MVQLNENLE